MGSQELRVALCGIGLQAYWEQFPGLRERLQEHIGQLAEQVKNFGAVVVDLGLIDTAAKGREAGHECRKQDVDLLLIYVTTYALSSTVLPLIRRAKVPVLVLNLQPTPAIDYAAFNALPNRTAMTGEWLAYCSACPVPEIANVLRRANVPFQQVTGYLGEAAVWQEIADWIEAAKAKHALAQSRLGLLGHYYTGMLDIFTDLAEVCIRFGCDIEHLEVDELSALREQVMEAEWVRRAEEFRERFDIQPDCPAEEVTRAATTSVALDKFVASYDLQALAYYYKGTGVATNADTMSSIILGTSLLTARGIPVAGEYEVKNLIAMKILESFGAGGSFTEYYALDLLQDHVLMGHDGPGHVAIAETKTKVRPLEVYHGKVGRGLSVEMTVKHGPVTLLSVVDDREHGFKLLAAHGQSVPGEVLRIGNTNSHYAFSIGARAFVERWNEHGPAHHCAVGVGHLCGRLRKLASLLEIPFVQIC